MTTIAVLGTGIMGAPMARKLAEAGNDVRVWNRTREKAEPLADVAAVADSPAVREVIAAAQPAEKGTMMVDRDYSVSFRSQEPARTSG